MYAKRPMIRVRKSCLTPLGERSLEFSGAMADRGGIIGFREHADGIVVDLSYLGPEVEVRVDPEKIGRALVNYDARTGDVILRANIVWQVAETYPNAITITSPMADAVNFGGSTQTVSYKNLLLDGALYLHQVKPLSISSICGVKGALT